MKQIEISRAWLATVAGGLAAFALLLLVTSNAPRDPVPVPTESPVTSWVTEYVDPETPTVTVLVETPTVTTTATTTTTDTTSKE